MKGALNRYAVKIANNGGHRDTVQFCHRFKAYHFRTSVQNFVDERVRTPLIPANAGNRLIKCLMAGGTDISPFVNQCKDWREIPMS